MAQMNKEHEQKQGRSWIASFVVTAIDEALLPGRPKEQRALVGRCINLVDMIITPLVLEKIPFETLEHLNIEFVSPKKDTEVAEKIHQELERVEEILTAEFGSEVVRRLKLSISEKKVRDLPHK